jgi:folate-dependent phosphoribosylglycinamide formyltransferase PurN
VASNNPGAQALRRCAEAGVETAVFDRAGFAGQDVFRLEGDRNVQNDLFFMVGFRVGML